MRARCLALVATLAFAPALYAAAPLSSAEASGGWVLLFDRESLFGWTTAGRAAWNVAGGALTAESSDATTLRTNAAFADFELHLEFRVHGDAGVYLRIPPTLKLQDANRIQLDGSDAENPPGTLTGEKHASRVMLGQDWNALDVMASGEHITVRIDGQVATDATTSRSGLGFVGLYVASGAKGEFRNVRLRPLGMQALYNGANLDGWKLAAPEKKPNAGPHKFLNVIPMPAPPHKEKTAQWSVTGGLVHGEKGPGQIETQALYDDFVLQFEARDKSGRESRGEMNLVLRGLPGKFASGYESPLGNPPQMPVGSIGRFQTARRSAYTNGEFFAETVVARGRHFSVWVNGFPVTDFEDRRPVGQNLASEARLGKGTIAMAAMGNSSDVDFRTIRIAELTAPAAPAPKTETSAKPPAVAPAPSPVAAPPTSAPPAAPVPSVPQSNPVVEQLARQQAREQSRQQTVSQLMQQALTRKTPVEQVAVYNEILKIDPANQVAFGARKDAQDRIEAREREAAARSQQTQQQERLALDREAAKGQALAGAERALLRGDLHRAQLDMATARRLAPEDPAVLRLSSIVESRLRVRSRIRFMLFGGCAAGSLFGLALLIRRWRRRTPYLLMAEGLEKGKEYVLKTKVTRIGAVAQEGGMQNDIVIKDLDHSISRFHCEIHQVKGRLYLLDCNSSNGTYLNGRQIRAQRPARLGRGSRIGLGRSCSLTVEYRGLKSPGGSYGK